MLKLRVIPVLLWKDHGLVKGVGFDSWRRIGSAMPAVKVYNRRDVDELILVDISATPETRGPDLEEIELLAAECFVPFTVGGGVSSVEAFADLLRAGADKVCVNSAAYDHPDLLTEAANRFGTQCVVASIDVRRENGRYECYDRCGTHPTGREVVDWATEVERRGAGEILLTSIERDGTMKGYDETLISRVSASVQIPVIAAGGAGDYQHALQAVHAGANAIAAASIFHFTEQTPLEMKRFLAEAGVPTRVNCNGVT